MEQYLEQDAEEYADPWGRRHPTLTTALALAAGLIVARVASGALAGSATVGVSAAIWFVAFAGTVIGVSRALRGPWRR